MTPLPPLTPAELQAQVAKLLEDFVRRENFGGFPFIDMGVDLGVDKTLQGFLDFEVFVGELHGVDFEEDGEAQT